LHFVIAESKGNATQGWFKKNKKSAKGSTFDAVSIAAQCYMTTILEREMDLHN
jgi:hypothetical protein